MPSLYPIHIPRSRWIPTLARYPRTTSSHRGSNPPAQQSPLHHSRRTTSHSAPGSIVPRSRCKFAPPPSPRRVETRIRVPRIDLAMSLRRRYVDTPSQPCGNGCRDLYRHLRPHNCCSAPRDPCWNLFRPEIILAAGYSYRA